MILILSHYAISELKIWADIFFRVAKRLFTSPISGLRTQTYKGSLSGEPTKYLQQKELFRVSEKVIHELSGGGMEKQFIPNKIKEYYA